MKRFRRLFASVLIGALMVSSLGLAGCIGPGKEGALVLPSAKITAPAISQSGVLRVGVDSSRVPFAGTSDGQIIGIDVDVAAALAEELGLQLQIIDIKGQDVSALLADGTLDVAMGVQTDPTLQTTFAGAQIGPYLIDGPAAFTVSYSVNTSDFDKNALNGARVAAQEGSLSAWQVDKDFGSENLQAFPALNSAFDELLSGGVSYVAADAIVGSFLAVKYADVNCVGLLAEPTGIYMGVSTDKAELATALTASLRNIRDNGTLQIIIAKWLGPISAQTVSSDKAIVSLTGAGTADGDAAAVEGETGAEGAGEAEGGETAA
jgi:polar amino acid transport system substrate-binding protein